MDPDHIVRKLDEILKVLHGSNGLVTRVALLEQRLNSQTAKLWDSAKIVIAVAVAWTVSRFYG